LELTAEKHLFPFGGVVVFSDPGGHALALGLDHLLEAHVLELDFHLLTGVKLQGDEPLKSAFLVVGIFDFSSELAIDEVAELRALCDDAVGVPSGEIDSGDFQGLDDLGFLVEFHPLAAFASDATALFSL
jgi:hypothetical protein